MAGRGGGSHESWGVAVACLGGLAGPGRPIRWPGPERRGLSPGKATHPQLLHHQNQPTSLQSTASSFVHSTKFSNFPTMAGRLIPPILACALGVGTAVYTFRTSNSPRRSTGTSVIIPFEQNLTRFVRIVLLNLPDPPWAGLPQSRCSSRTASQRVGLCAQRMITTQRERKPCFFLFQILSTLTDDEVDS